MLLLLEALRTCVLTLLFLPLFLSLLFPLKCTMQTTPFNTSHLTNLDGFDPADMS